MKAQEIQAKIDKVSEAIDKKYALIEKRQIQAQKKLATLNKEAGEILGTEPIVYDDDMQVLAQRLSDAKKVYYERRGADEEDAIKSRAWNGYYWTICDLEYQVVESVRNARNAIKEKEQTRERYLDQLRKVEEKDQAIQDMPQVIKDFMDRTIEMWDRYDMGVKRPALKEAKEEYRRLDKEGCDLYNDWKNREQNKDRIKELEKEKAEIRDRFSSDDWENLLDKTDEQIHEDNVESAKVLVMNFYQRVCAIVGEVEDASGLRLDVNNAGYTIINGYAKGNGKVAKVESIGAGGWNIQRWHIRVLVHEIRQKGVE